MSAFRWASYMMAALCEAQESGGEWLHYGLIPFITRAVDSFDATR